MLSKYKKDEIKFQSTLPKWAATKLDFAIHVQFRNFNPRCPSGQRQNKGGDFMKYTKISIHAAQVGSD